MPQDITLEPGCYLDSHRGHYIVRDMIELAISHGYIVDGFVRFALDAYDEHCHEDDYPTEGLIEVADDALAWLNVGDNSGRERPIKGQNNPPAVPDGYAWDWNDGDFGLYEIEQD
jgi:hypothetical protein